MSTQKHDLDTVDREEVAEALVRQLARLLSGPEGANP